MIEREPVTDANLDNGYQDRTSLRRSTRSPCARRRRWSRKRVVPKERVRLGKRW
jgi:hypothetical protein